MIEFLEAAGGDTTLLSAHSNLTLDGAALYANKLAVAHAKTTPLAVERAHRSKR